MKRTTTLLLLLLATLPLTAQVKLGRGELGLAFGGMNYLGDLNDQSMLGRVNLAGGLTARLNLNTRWALALGGSYGHIQGGNPDVDVRRNLSFRSHITEGFLRVEFNFFSYGLQQGTQKRLSPYIFCGIGLFTFAPQAQYIDSLSGRSEWYDLQPLGTEGQGSPQYPNRQKYQLVETCMPFGIGFRYRLSPSVHFTVEYGWRKTWTDYLDDVSTTYVGEAVLKGDGGGGTIAALLADRSGEVQEGYVNAPGIKRGDDSLDDWYAYFNLTLSVSMEALFGWMRGKQCEL